MIPILFLRTSTKKVKIYGWILADVLIAPHKNTFFFCSIIPTLKISNRLFYSVALIIYFYTIFLRIIRKNWDHFFSQISIGNAWIRNRCLSKDSGWRQRIFPSWGSKWCSPGHSTRPRVLNFVFFFRAVFFIEIGSYRGALFDFFGRRFFCCRARHRL